MEENFENAMVHIPGCSAHDDDDDDNGDDDLMT